MSLLVALYILKEAFQLLRRSLREILDERLPDTIRDEIERLIAEHRGELFDYHNLRTRRAGSQKLIDFHLTVCKHLSVEEAHRITDVLEAKIGDQVSGSDVTIHIEPCRLADCPGRDECPALKIRPRKDQRGD
jgi:divalent metal cation (Fe/Co/Zn/Cd) transporter